MIKQVRMSLLKDIMTEQGSNRFLFKVNTQDSLEVLKCKFVLCGSGLEPQTAFGRLTQRSEVVFSSFMPQYFIWCLSQIGKPEIPQMFRNKCSGFLP